MTASPAPSSTVTIPSRLFGPTTVDREDIIQFASGLEGFAGQNRFVILPTEHDGLFWLQSADEGNLAFLTIDPFGFFPKYEVPMPPDGVGPFSPDQYGDMIVLTIVTLPREKHLYPTTNLNAPLVIHPVSQQGMQMSIATPEHSARVAFKPKPSHSSFGDETR